jgi:hypothetical protein
MPHIAGIASSALKRITFTFIERALDHIDVIAVRRHELPVWGQLSVSGYDLEMLADSRCPKLDLKITH